MADKLEFHEPSGDAPAGYHIYTRSHSPYERYVEEEGIPVFRGIGVYDTRELELGDWKRTGGRGCFLWLDGIETKKGMFVVEVPARGALKAQRHMYDEFYLVIEGRGTTEVWRTGQAKPHVFEWQAGTLFTVPINANFRFVNATSSPALLLAANNAPPIFNLFQSHRFLFENEYDFVERFDGSDDFFKPKTDLEAEPVRGRAAIRSNVFTDIINCNLPLDNQRAPGYRRIQPYFHGFLADATTGGFIAEYPIGKYSKAHFHQSGAVLVCLKGAGYTYNWPIEAGPRPWEAGKGDAVKICEYKQGGLVAAAPGGGNWFHQHFSVGSEPMRVINYWGGPTGDWGVMFGEEGDQVKAGNIYGIEEGGRTIHYPSEDPYIRKYFADRLAQYGVQSQMTEDLFVKDAHGHVREEAVPHHH